MRLRFPKAARLARTSEFHRVREQGRSWPGRFFILGVLCREDATETTRIGFVTSKRVGNAVERNRARRQLRDIVRRHRPELRAGRWLVLVARHPMVRAEMTALEAEWLRLGRRAGIFQRPPPPPPSPEREAVVAPV